MHKGSLGIIVFALLLLGATDLAMLCAQDQAVTPQLMPANAADWSFIGGKNFAHPQPLAGKHAQISCQTCHTQGVAIKPDGCITCHGDQHNGLKNCVDCHQLSGWIPSTFQHPQEGPHVPNGDEKLQCNACHAAGFGQKASCPCHGGNPPSGGG